mmetsp:Transcript_18434/g.69742  ORF Transcript_18434/g.69742 Transcript_18434/m.69742 type:complete len:180 (-) Transcript_18434:2652-3191(-)|eukprot:scaffold7067_cov245-Pinguiococcus_pyrenoidosus.AAC.17
MMTTKARRGPVAVPGSGAGPGPVALARTERAGAQNQTRRKRHAESQAKHYQKKKQQFERLRAEHNTLKELFVKVVHLLPEDLRAQVEAEAATKLPSDFGGADIAAAPVAVAAAPAAVAVSAPVGVGVELMGGAMRAQHEDEADKMRKEDDKDGSKEPSKADALAQNEAPLPPVVQATEA